jgi:hypothetical protein
VTLGPYFDDTPIDAEQGVPDLLVPRPPPCAVHLRKGALGRLPHARLAQQRNLVIGLERIDDRRDLYFTRQANAISTENLR